ncbi:helix-turn-helix transcriptional regulator [Roseibium sediminicola]|uniref:Helix-turn-helix transcriptional regulator n=1 Tax=Roseibium sediminicola TaxID=2933272 RepID=A0ABT0GXZ0_9HYPH|nr:helix-turn-helix transcriptional regulator [Roseibium sp. CAU 1639]MCK7614186.1 helix-turn-helix transcriptional regulator [Roseibium sp. CAU 1639]
MISIPVSFLLAALFSALALAAFAWRSLPLQARGMFAALFCLMALEASLVGMRFAYGHFEFLALQRVLPVWVAPGVYLAFCALTGPAATFRRRILFHGLIALAVTVAMAMPVRIVGYIDALIAGSYMIYTLALIRLWLEGADRFSEAPTALGGLLHRLLLLAIFAMAATLFVDVWIALLFAQARQDAAARAVSVASLLFLVAAIILVLLSLRSRRTKRSGAKSAAVADGEKGALVETARHLLIGQGLFRDPGLTLTRLARRAGVPDRDLSRAINSETGMSVSQFVNQVRLEEAARLLKTTDAPVTRIQEEVGFLTRSNFYREFQKAYGAAPGAFRKRAHSPS